MAAKRTVSKKLAKIKSELQTFGVKVRFVELAGGRTWSCKYGACILRGQDFLLVDRKLPEPAIYSFLLEELDERKQLSQGLKSAFDSNLQTHTGGTKPTGVN